MPGTSAQQLNAIIHTSYIAIHSHTREGPTGLPLTSLLQCQAGCPCEITARQYYLHVILIWLTILWGEGPITAWRCLCQKCRLVRPANSSLALSANTLLLSRIWQWNFLRSDQALTFRYYSIGLTFTHVHLTQNHISSFTSW